MSDYALKVPVEVYGQDQLKQVLDAIRGVGGATKGLSNDMLDYVRRAREEVDANLSLQKGLDALRRAKSGVSDEYKRLSTQLELYIIRTKEAEASTGRLQNVFGRLGGRIAGQDIGNAVGIPGLGRVGGTLIGASGLSGAGLLGIGAGVIGATLLDSIGKAIESTAKYAQAQRDLAIETGLTTQQTQQFASIATLAGLKSSDLTGIVTKLSKSMSDFGEDSKKQQRALSELGLDQSVAFEKPQRALEDVLGSLRKVTDEQERARLVTALYGEEGRKLLPLVDTWKSLADSAKAIGSGLSEESIDNLIRFRQQSEEVSLAWEQLKHSLAEKIVATIEFVTAGNPGGFTNKLSGIPGISGAIGGFAVAGPAGALYGALGQSYLSNAYGDQGGPIAPGITPPDPFALAQAQRRDEIAYIREQGKTLPNQLREQLAKTQQDQETASGKYLRTGDAASKQQLVQTSQQALSLQQQIKIAEEAARQLEDLSKLPVPETAEDLLKQAAELRGPRFNRIQGTPQMQAFVQSLNTQLVGPNGFATIGRQRFADLNANPNFGLVNTGGQVQEFEKNQARDAKYQEELAKANRGRVSLAVETGGRGRNLPPYRAALQSRSECVCALAASGPAIGYSVRDRREERASSRTHRLSRKLTRRSVRRQRTPATRSGTSRNPEEQQRRVNEVR